MKDVIFVKKDHIEYSKDIHEKIYNNLLTAKDRKTLEDRDIQIIVDFKKLTPMKTLKQLGYIYAEIYFKAWLGYMIIDGVKYDMDETIGMLKVACGLAYQSGVPKSLAKASIDEASTFIERAFLFINENLPVTCEDSETWKEKKRNRV